VSRLSRSSSLFAFVVIAVAAASEAGCKGSRAGHVDSTGGADGVPPLPTPTRGASDTATIATPQGSVVVRADSTPGAIAVPAVPLQWSRDTVLMRLASAGLAPRAQGDVRQPFFDPPGLRIELSGGRAEVQAFIFGDAGATNRATSALDTTRVSAPTMRVTWPMPPALVVNNNLAAIVLTRDRALRARIRSALVTHQR
jgi:hypothetical protein